MGAEFQGSWHLYETYPPGVIAFSLWILSLLSFGFLGHCLSLHMSLCFSVPLLLSPCARLWPGLARASCTGINRAQLLGSGCAARLFGAPGTRLGKESAFLATSPGQALPCLASALL